MKVAQIIDTNLNAPGGVEKHILRLSESLRRLGPEVDVFGRESQSGSENYLDLKNFQPQSYDIIHTHSDFISREMLRGVFKRPHNQKRVHTLHGLGLTYLFACKTWLNYRCYTSMLVNRFWSQRADAVITVSSEMAQQAQRWFGISPEKINVVANGYTPLPSNAVSREQTRQRFSLAADHLVLLFVGRGLDRVKGSQTIQKALDQLYPNFPHLRLLAAPGDGFDPRPWLIPTGLLNHSEVYQCYLAADIFVNASLTEGMPLTLLDALAAGLAIVAAPVGGIAETIQPNQTGLLLNPQRSNLAEQIKLLIENPTLRQSLASEAKKLSAKFTWENTAQNTLKIYQKAKKS